MGSSVDGPERTGTPTPSRTAWLPRPRSSRCMLERRCLLSGQKSYHFLQRPNVVGKPSRHRRGDPERLMDTDEVVMDEVNRHGQPVVLELLGEGVRQAGEPAHGHPHREVAAFNVGRAHERYVRVPADLLLAGANHLTGAVFALCGGV